MAQPSTRDLVYLGHILDLAREASGVLGVQGRDAYDRDRNLRLALSHLVQNIGEAARRLSPEFKAARSEIEWAAIVGMRHHIVHEYMRVDEDAVWTTVTEELPLLIGQLERLSRET